MELRITAGNERALVLVQGKGKDTDWRPLVEQLKKHKDLDKWDIHAFDFLSRWLPKRVKYGFALSPGLDQVAKLFTTFCLSNLRKYQSLSIIAHSLGGLAVQRALFNNEWLSARTTHMGLFATPNGGLTPRLFFSFHPQLRDALSTSPFMVHLQQDRERFLRERTCAIRAVTGSEDRGVSAASVFCGFPESIQRTLPGDHSTILHPKSQDAPIIDLIIDFLTSPRLFLSYVREDEEKVLSVFETLEKSEFTPWIDQRRLESGEAWADSIQDALHESDRVLVFLSRSALAELSNVRGVFRKEVDTAIAIQRRRGRKEPFVIPVRLEELDLPEMLEGYQWFDLFTKGEKNLADQLKRTVR